MTVLVERDGELERLGSRLDAARSGDGALVVLEGAPGLGEVAALCADPQTELLDLRALSAAGTQALLAEWFARRPRGPGVLARL